MKRTELVALSRAAIQRASSNQIGVIGPTKKQLRNSQNIRKRKTPGSDLSALMLGALRHDISTLKTYQIA
jgi:hypothetical protein